MSASRPDETFASDSGRIIGRFGDAVHRKVDAWTPAVHRLLQHLETVEFPYSPRVRGFDAEGNEVLTYIEGMSGKDIWVTIATDVGLRAFARMLRAYHDAVADYRPTKERWATGHAEVDANDIICHGDFGPWNTVWQGDLPVGIVDWDLAGPRPRMYDVAYALEYAAPFRADEECVKWLGYQEVPERKQRIRAFAEAYGLPSADGLFEEVVNVQEAGIEELKLMAERGVRPQVNWVKDGHLEDLRQRADWSRAHEHLFVERAQT